MDANNWWQYASLHWQFIAWTVIAYVIGSFVRRHVFTQALAVRSSPLVTKGHS